MLKNKRRFSPYTIKNNDTHHNLKKIKASQDFAQFFQTDNTMLYIPKMRLIKAEAQDPFPNKTVSFKVKDSSSRQVSRKYKPYSLENKSLDRQPSCELESNLTLTNLKNQSSNIGLMPSSTKDQRYESYNDRGRSSDMRKSRNYKELSVKVGLGRPQTPSEPSQSAGGKELRYAVLQNPQPDSSTPSSKASRSQGHKYRDSGFDLKATTSNRKKVKTDSVPSHVPKESSASERSKHAGIVTKTKNPPFSTSTPTPKRRRDKDCIEKKLEFVDVSAEGSDTLNTHQLLPLLENSPSDEGSILIRVNKELDNQDDRIIEEIAEEKNTKPVKPNTINNDWIEFQEILANNFEEFRLKWKIVIDNTRDNKNDKAYYMLCKFNECKVQYKARIPFKPKPDTKVTIFMKKDTTHNHEIAELQTLNHHGIHKDVKDLALPMLLNKVKSNKILKVLEEYADQGLISKTDLPSTTQLSSFRNTQCKKGLNLETEADFHQLFKCFDPENVASDGEGIIIGHNLKPDDLCIVFSSKILLRNIINQAATSSIKYMCLDGTYKLTVLGYPLLVIGTHDSNHKFKLIALALSKHERQQDYEFVLNSVRHSLKEFYQHEWDVDFVMADGSRAIYDAVRAVFGEIYIHGMCSVHMWRNVEKRIVLHVPSDDRQELREDLKLLENIHDSHLFTHALSLFQKKWQQFTGFLDYFYSTWIDSPFSNWYLGSIPSGFSHTNNLIEGFNLAIKAKYSGWEKFKLGEFMQLLDEILLDYSKMALDAPFPTQRHIPKDIWEKSQKMMEDPYLKLSPVMFYWARLCGQKHTGRKKTTKQMSTKFNSLNRARTFDSFKTNFCLWKAVIGATMDSTSCSCPKFRTYGYCKHIIVALLKLKKIHVPPEYSLKKIVSENKQQGRHKKATRALQREDA